MANKVKYGLKNVYYAVLKTDGTSSALATYDKPVRWPGAVNLSLDAEGDTNKFFADNITYAIFVSNSGYSGSLESALVPDSFRKDILGDIENTTDGTLTEDAGAITKHFALLFQFEGDQSGTRHVMYNCSATRPSVSGATTEDSVEAQTESVDLSAASIYNKDVAKDIVKSKCEYNADPDSAYAKWFDEIYQPTA